MEQRAGPRNQARIRICPERTQRSVGGWLIRWAHHILPLCRHERLRAQGAEEFRVAVAQESRGHVRWEGRRVGWPMSRRHLRLSAAHRFMSAIPSSTPLHTIPPRLVWYLNATGLPPAAFVSRRSLPGAEGSATSMMLTEVFSPMKSPFSGILPPPTCCNGVDRTAVASAVNCSATTTRRGTSAVTPTLRVICRVGGLIHALGPFARARVAAAP